MTWLLSVDPGVRRCGCALWEGPELRAAALVDVDPRNKRSWYHAVHDLSYAIRRWSWKRLPAVLHLVNRLVVEMPQTYGGRAERGDANDLIMLAYSVGQIVARSPADEMLLVHPREWKGSVPKSTSKAEYERNGYVIELRARRELGAEVSRVDLPPTAWRTKLDVWDAVGIGLWDLKKRGIR